MTDSRALKSDERGSVAIIFALTGTIVMGMIGGAVDYGRAVKAREQIQKAVDASVLAAARVWQTTKDLTLAEQHATQYYLRNKPKDISSGVSGFTPDLARNAIQMTAEANIGTPFLSLILENGYRVTARAEALLAVGGNAQTNLEISLMLDVTGSMGGSKLVDMQDAAKDLVDIVIWDDQSEYTSKIALAPFSARINTGPYTAAMTGLPATWNGKKLKTCVTDRWGVAQHTDALPAATPDTYLGPYSPSNGNSPISMSSQYSNSGACTQPTAEIMPLTSDKTALKTRIDSFEADGGTAGALGTQMAWYLISPNWASIWPAASQPVAYNTPKFQKIAVLMTDGDYNVYRGASMNAESVNAHAKSICRDMKDAGVTVYTIGFELPTNKSRDVMRDCATDESKFYDAANGDALRQAFRDIALQIAKLRLSQ